MNKRLLRTLTLSTLALLGVTMACTNAGASGTTPIGVGTRPTIGPNRPPSGPSVHQVEQTTTLTGTSTGPATATCPQGEVALGGGWSVPPQQAQGARVFAAMVTGNTWAVSVTHPAPAAEGSVTGNSPTLSSLVTPVPVAGLTVIADVECLRGATGAVVTRRATQLDLAPTSVAESNDHLGGQIAVCTQGEVLVGFGFDFGSPTAKLELEEVWPRDDLLPVATMVFSVRNHDSVAHAITLSADCLSNVQASASYPRHDGDPVFVVGTTGFATETCPAGTELAGGGLAYTRHDTNTGSRYLGNLITLKSVPIEPTSKADSEWTGQMYTMSGFGLIPVTLFVAAVCLKL